MELLSWSIYAICVPAVIFAGISKGGFGSGVAFASASILALVLEPVVAVGLMLPLLMVMDVTALKSYWRQWDKHASKLLIVGMIPGCILGALFFARADADVIRLLIGILSVGFVIWQGALAIGLLKVGQRKASDTTGLIAGVATGFTSFVSHAGGPPSAVYLLGMRLEKTAYQATTVFVFWAVNLFKSGFYATMGIFTQETLLLGLGLVPFAFLGVWIGVKAHHMVPERVFFGITYVALTITGVKLIWDALT